MVGGMFYSWFMVGEWDGFEITTRTHLISDVLDNFSSWELYRFGGSS